MGKTYKQGAGGHDPPHAHRSSSSTRGVSSSSAPSYDLAGLGLPLDLALYETAPFDLHSALNNIKTAKSDSSYQLPNRPPAIVPPVSSKYWEVPPPANLSHQLDVSTLPLLGLPSAPLPPPVVSNISAAEITAYSAENELSTAENQVSKYSQLLLVLEEMAKDLRPCYAGNRASTERLKRGIAHARILVREALLEVERASR